MHPETVPHSKPAGGAGIADSRDLLQQRRIGKCGSPQVRPVGPLAAGDHVVDRRGRVALVIEMAMPHYLIVLPRSGCRSRGRAEPVPDPSRSVLPQIGLEGARVVPAPPDRGLRAVPRIPPSGGDLCQSDTAGVTCSSARTGSRGQQACEERVAHFELRWRAQQLPTPGRSGAAGDLNLGPARDETEPDDAERLKWFPLTTLRERSDKDAQPVLDRDQLHWRIEERHRVLKAGCKVEYLGYRRWIGSRGR